MNTAMPGQDLIPQSSRPVMIAGKGGGRPILCAPSLAAEVKKLEDADKRGNHWARVAIKELRALTSGHLGKRNVFIEESPHLRRHVVQSQTQNNPYIKHSITLFYAFLPGLKATIAQRPDGSYFVLNMVLDGRYTEATESKQPGLYEVSKVNPSGHWQVKYKESGNISQTNYRAVAISDCKSDDPQEVADGAARSLFAALGSGSQRQMENEGFDLHFTPGNKRLGSLVRYEAVKVKSGFGSAVHLADTMEAARSTTGVRWVSEFGGSAILTQAMKILAVKGAALDGHEAYFYRPKTSPGDAIRLAHQLKFELAEKVALTGLDPVGAISQRRVASDRLNNKNDRYDNSAHNRAIVGGIGKSTAVIGIVAGAGMVVGGAFAMVAAVTKALAGTASIISAGVAASSMIDHIAEPHVDKLKRLGRRR
ncbi:hypothetical protein [Marinimicrobium koreense]|uniref:hypothetical protein n=1 Tax=Marinimicrobium koreense TaxID=306545 RepID=UPI003F70EA38